MKNGGSRIKWRSFAVSQNGVARPFSRIIFRTKLIIIYSFICFARLKCGEIFPLQSLTVLSVIELNRLNKSAPITNNSNFFRQKLITNKILNETNK